MNYFKYYFPLTRNEAIKSIFKKCFPFFLIQKKYLEKFSVIFSLKKRHCKENCETTIGQGLQFLRWKGS